MGKTNLKHHMLGAKHPLGNGKGQRHCEECGITFSFAALLDNAAFGAETDEWYANVKEVGVLNNTIYTVNGIAHDGIKRHGELCGSGAEWHIKELGAGKGFASVVATKSDFRGNRTATQDSMLAVAFYRETGCKRDEAMGRFGAKSNKTFSLANRIVTWLTALPSPQPWSRALLSNMVCAGLPKVNDMTKVIDEFGADAIEVMPDAVADFYHSFAKQLGHTYNRADGMPPVSESAGRVPVKSLVEAVAARLSVDAEPEPVAPKPEPDAEPEPVAPKPEPDASGVDDDIAVLLDCLAANAEEEVTVKLLGNPIVRQLIQKAIQLDRERA